MKFSMIWRNTLREIRGSLGRFLAIFAIVALGVGLFSGLKITKADFLRSMENYFADRQFYDYRILGELGFSEDQAEFLSGQEDVACAEGAIFKDVYYDENGSQKVGRIHSLTQKLNKVVLIHGRMPEKEGEILADYMHYNKDDIGKKIIFSQENEEEDLSMFVTDTYEIVGIVKSPLYVQFERGNTALGAGTVDSFFYLPYEGFDVDYYSEIYVKFRQNYELYSGEYQDFLDAKNEEWERLAKEAGHGRFLELPQIIEKAENTLAEQREEAWRELEDARKELEKAQEEIKEGEEKLADGKRELENGREELEKAKQELADGKDLIEEKEPELARAKEEVEEGEKKIAEQETLLKEKEAELEQGKKALETSRMTLQLGEMQQKLTMEGLISEQRSIDSSREELEKRQKRVEALELFAQQAGQAESFATQIAEEKAAIAKENVALDRQTEDLHKRYVECLTLGDQVSQGRRDFEAAEKQVTEGEKALEDGKSQLLKAKKELLSAREQIRTGEAELRNAKNKVREGEKEISDGEMTLAEKEREWKDGEEELKKGKKELADGQEEYREALEEFQDKIQKAEDAITEKREQYEAGEEPETYLLGRDTNIGYVCFENDSAIVEGVANVFPVFFFLVAALVCVTTMNRMVEEQRTQIGILKALGYSDGRIMFKFLFYSGSAAILGCILGYAGGTIVFPYIIWTVYGIMYKAGPIAFTFSPFLASVSLLVSVLCSVGTTYLSCGKELASQAASLMRPKSPKAGKRVFLEYLPLVWKRLSFLRKVAVRNIMRYKKRLFMMVLGIGGCTGLLVTGFGLKDSIAGVAYAQFSEIQNYDIGVSLQNEADAAFLEKLEKLREKGLQDYLPYQENILELENKDARKNVTVITLPSDVTTERLSEYITMRSKEGEPIAIPKEKEVVLTDKIARQLQIDVGDQVILRDDDRKERSFVVSGIMENYIYNYAFLAQEDCHPKALYVKAQEGGKMRRLSAALMKLEGVVNISVTEDVVNRFDKMMSSMNLIVILVTCCAAGLAFVVLYNLTNINITERIREIATIKVLGFFASETALYVFRENLVLTFLGAVAGLGLGKLLHAFVIHEIDFDMVDFAVRIYPQSYVYSILLTFVFSMAVNLMMNRKLDEVSMTESLKSVD